MKLIGSIASPFVRRVRAVLKKEQLSYDFQVINVFSQEGQDELLKYGPLRRVPLLIKSNEVIFDSTIICEDILTQKGKKLTTKEKLMLKLVDEMTDSAVHLFQLKSFKLDENHQSKFSTNHKQRVLDTLEYLNNVASDIKVDSLEGIWLFCTLDWFRFRSIEDFSKLSGLESFYISALGSDLFKDSDPRNQ